MCVLLNAKAGYIFSNQAKMPFRIYVLALCRQSERILIKRKFVLKFELGGLHRTYNGIVATCVALSPLPCYQCYMYMYIILLQKQYTAIFGHAPI